MRGARRQLECGGEFVSPASTDDICLCSGRGRYCDAAGNQAHKLRGLFYWSDNSSLISENPAVPTNFFATLLCVTSFCFLMVGCDSGPSGEDPPSSVEGVWESGTVESPEEDFIVRFRLDQESKKVSGTLKVEFVESGQVDRFSILDGVYNAPDLDLDIETDATDGAASESLSCTVGSSSSMSCDDELNGQSLDINLTKKIGDDSEGSGEELPGSVDGLWESGTVDSPEEDFIARLNLSQNRNDISGALEVEFVESGQVETFSILDGVYNAPELNLDIETDATDGSTSESLSCTVESSSSMSCDDELNGQTLDITLNKQ